MLVGMDDVRERGPGTFLDLDEVNALRDEFSRFMFSYKFGMEEVATKVGILQQEFQHLQKYNPIEHVTSRLKTPESVLDKIARKNCEPRFETIRETITDSRRGVMPRWGDKLDPVTIRMLATYVHSLGGGEAAPVAIPQQTATLSASHARP